MKVLILAAMPEEIMSLEKQLHCLEDSRILSARFWQGNISGHSIYVAQTGIGLVNASLITAVSLERFSPDYVINIGVAGGIDERLQVGDVVIGEEMAYNNVDARVFGYEYGQVPGGWPTRFESDPKLLGLSDFLHADLGEIQILRGLIVSGDEFMSTKEQVSEIMSHWPEALSVDMETTAMAHACHRFSVPFVAMRIISDIAATVPSNKKTYENFMPIAANIAVSLLTHFLGHL